jgi:HPt (histidine-containing phosphotransfer) domain-containing protein
MSNVNAPHPSDGPLLSTLAGDPDMAELVTMFVSEMPERIAALQDAIGHSDLETLRKLAHQLKGSAGGYGFQPITESAAVVERSAKAPEPLEMIRKSADELIDLCRRASVK